MAIEVQTTQNVTIDYEPAGIGYRLLAYIVDWVVILLWVAGWIGILYWLLSTSFFDYYAKFDSYGIFIYIFILSPAFFYDLLMESLNSGQSIGKMLFKIRVVNTDGTTPSFGAYLIRWLFRLVDFSMTEGLLSIIMIAVTDKSQRLGDYLAGTTVIDLKCSSKNRELQAPNLDFNDNYQVVFLDVLDRLSDKDIQTILSIIDDFDLKNTEYFTHKLAERIRMVTGYSFNGSDLQFLRKVVNDYNYLAIQ